MINPKLISARINSEIHYSSGILSSGFIYAPYVPIHISPLLSIDADKFYKKYASKVIEGKFYETVTIP